MVLWCGQIISDKIFCLDPQSFDGVDIKGLQVIKHHNEFFMSLASNLKSGTLVRENLSKCPNKHVKNVHVPGAWTSLRSFCELIPRKEHACSSACRSVGPLVVLVETWWDEFQKQKTTRSQSKLTIRKNPNSQVQSVEEVVKECMLEIRKII